MISIFIFHKTYSQDKNWLTQNLSKLEPESGRVISTCDSYHAYQRKNRSQSIKDEIVKIFFKKK